MKALYLALVAGQLIGVTFAPGVTVKKKLGAGAKTSVETYITNNLCADVNARLVADGGSANCAPGRDGDELTVTWTGTGVSQEAFAIFRSSHPYSATPQ